MTFLQGLKSPIDGFKLFIKHPSLRNRVYLPFFLTVVISIVGIVAFAFWMPAFYDSIQDILIKHIEPEIRAKYSQEVLDMIMGTLAMVVKAVVYLVAILLLMLMIFFVSSILCSVFWEFLADEVMRLYSPDRAINRGIKNVWIKPMVRESVKQFTFAVVIVASYLVAFVPIVGSLISLLVGPILVSVWFAILVCDYWMNILDWSINQRYRFVIKHWLYLLGMGSYLAIPMIGFLLYPFFVIGSTFHAAQTQKK